MYLSKENEIFDRDTIHRNLTWGFDRDAIHENSTWDFDRGATNMDLTWDFEGVQSIGI